MSIQSTKFEGGQIFLPRGASRLDDLETELFSLPRSRFDDQMDSISQALAYEIPTDDWTDDGLRGTHRLTGGPLYFLASIRSVCLKVSQEFAEFHHWFPCWCVSLSADSGGLIHPWRTASSRRASETSGLRPGAGGPSSATTRSRSVTKTVSPPAASRMYSLSLFLAV
jgi:hypothetical protein